MGKDEKIVPQGASVQPVSSPGSMNNGQLNTSISNLTKAINKNTSAREEPKSSDTKSTQNSILPSSNSPSTSMINPPSSNSPATSMINPPSSNSSATLSNTFKKDIDSVVDAF